jgi:hypothetical protein
MISHFLLSFCVLFVSTSSQLVVQQYPPQPELNNGLSGFQTPIMPESDPKVSMTQQVTLADLLGRNSQIQIFSGLARDVDSASRRFEDPGENSTVLAPENAVVTKLPRKPWEDTDDYHAFGADAYAGDEGKNRAQQNLKRFVEAHVVPQSPWAEGDKVETLAGSTIWYEKIDGGLVVSVS